MCFLRYSHTILRVKTVTNWRSRLQRAWLHNHTVGQKEALYRRKQGSKWQQLDRNVVHAHSVNQSQLKRDKTVSWAAPTDSSVHRKLHSTTRFIDSAHQSSSISVWIVVVLSYKAWNKKSNSLVWTLAVVYLCLLNLDTMTWADFEAFWVQIRPSEMLQEILHHLSSWNSYCIHIYCLSLSSAKLLSTGSLTKHV